MTRHEHEARAGDEIGGPTTADLSGKSFCYTYSQGRQYRLTFDDTHVSFQMLSTPVGTAPRSADAPKPGALPYRARLLHDGQYLVHWLVPGRIGHVALVVDLPNRRIDVSALMPGQMEFFDVATIHSIDSANVTS